MNKSLLSFWSFLLVLAFIAAMGGSALSQAPLLIDNFGSPAGTQITTVGWAAHSGAGANPISTVTPGLTLSGYPGSGLGNAVSMTTSGEDANRTFAVQSSGSVYAALMVNVSDAAVDTVGGYFFHMGPDPIGTTFRGRVFIKKDASNNIAFGLSKSLTTVADIVYTPFSYSLNTTYLVIVKYTIVDGATNDTVTLFVLSNVPTTEPAPTLTATDVTQTDINPGSVALRQGTATTHPTLRADGIRVGTSWASVTQGPARKPANVDFDGDGRSDYAHARTQSGSLFWWIRQSSNGTVAVAQWGLATDRPVPTDYDGDGKTDIAIFREAPGTDSSFWILRSSNSTVQLERFGLINDDVSVTGDYDGDGKADVASYRCPFGTAGQCTWFYRGTLNNPTGAVTYVPWGFGVAGSPRPAPGDYDGDGKMDFCVFRNDAGQGQFVLRRSSDQVVEWVNWGLPADSVTPGDYDGDGKNDFAVARAPGANFNLYILERDGGGTGANPIVFASPAADDDAAFGDYDGDGVTDVGIWRDNADPNQNFFWIRLSTTGAVIVDEFGQLGDYPVAQWNFPREYN